MSKAASAAVVTTENFIDNWNTEFPNFPLTVEDLKKPHSVIGALFQIFDRIGIDRDAVLMPPPEKELNEHMKYYWDLLPVINVTRVINHLISVMPQVATISVNHFLQPTAHASHSILLLMFNLMVFNEERFRCIEPYEAELFNFSDMIKGLEDKRNEMHEKLNHLAEEKAKRSYRMEQMKQEIEQLEEEIQHEENARDKEKEELDALTRDNDATDVMLDQKRATKEGLLAERDRKKALRVYDAEDIRTKAFQAAQNVEEAEEKLNSMKTVIAQKESSLKILQIIKPNLDTANNLLQEITKLKEYELSDLEEESRAGELEVLSTAALELRAAADELAARRARELARRNDAAARRQRERSLADSEIRKEEEQDKKRREFITKAAQKTQEIKERTIKYEEQKTCKLETIEAMKLEYKNAVKEWEEALTKLVMDLKSDLEKKTAVLLESDSV